MPGGAPKICRSCGADLSGRSRTKMPSGAYVCSRCKRAEARRRGDARERRRIASWLVMVAAFGAAMFLMTRFFARGPAARGRR